MRVDRARLNWGILFIVLGGVVIAYNRNVVSSSTLSDAWRLWPLIVIGIGLKFVLSRTPAAFVGSLLVAVTVGAMIGSAFAVGPNIGCGGGHTGGTVARSGAFDTNANATVELNIQCGVANVSTSSDGQWHVNGTGNSGNAPSVDANGTWLRVRSADVHDWGFDRGKDDLQIQLPQNARISLLTTLDMGDARYNLGSANLASAGFTLNLGSLHVDLTGAQVGTLSVSTNLGSAFVTLDGSSDLSGDLDTNLGSLELCVPDGLGLKVTASDSLSSSDFDGLNMIRSGNEWKTPGYDTAAHHANLTASTSLGSLKIRHAGGCK
jgi:hypothetical protein